ncbi:hypothetical protein, partial [Clostridioides difficile]|uniref:hypothetical protein n=1 Tax=Clostridioides difficile TaxID=1496 RepID=UPI001F39D05A
NCKEIENKYYKITANKNGSLEILDKESNKTYKNQAVIEDNGDSSGGSNSGDNGGTSSGTGANIGKTE